MRRRYLYTILFFICYFIGFGQSYESKQFNKAEYLNVDNFTDFCQGENLLIYFATNKGIIQFDNYNFSYYKSINGKIENLNISSIAINDSVLYFSNSDALYSFDLRNQTLKKIHDQEVKNLASKNNSIYFNTNNTLYSIDSKKSDEVTKVFQDESINITTWIIDQDRIIIGTNQGLFDNNNSQNFNRIGTFLNIRSIKKDIDNAYSVLGDVDQGSTALFKYNDKSIKKLSELVYSNSTDLYLSNEGNMWISSEEGYLSVYTGLLLKTIEYES
ncbi:MAG: hypothetical protein R3321_13310, partial [Nitrososphaeraceae archaeon]|nr:hypothetical protein [Nitrososphaeraceae archaeon]